MTFLERCLLEEESSRRTKFLGNLASRDVDEKAEYLLPSVFEVVEDDKCSRREFGDEVDLRVGKLYATWEV